MQESDRSASFAPAPGRETRRTMSKRMRLPVILAIPAVLLAQSLRISDSAAARGSSGSFLVRLDAPAPPAASSIQWEMSISKQLAVELADILAGSSAESADKTIACAAVAQDPQASVYRCIVSGGTKGIANGPVAVVKYTVSRQARPGVAPVRIGKAFGVSKDGAKLDYRNSEGQIAIR
jgi:hypothetical protein